MKIEQMKMYTKYSEFKTLRCKICLPHVPPPPASTHTHTHTQAHEILCPFPAFLAPIIYSPLNISFHLLIALSFFIRIISFSSP